MKAKSSIFYYLVVCFLLLNCQTIDDKIFTEDDIVIPDLVVRTDLRGIVRSEEGNLLIGAKIKIGNESILTDENGYFAFKNITINAEGAIATISKGGFLTLQKLVIPQLADNYFQVRLLSFNQVGSFNSTNGGEISVTNGALVNFTANSIVDENENIYSGIVNVEAYYISPTNPYLGELMPGILLGIKNNNELSVLATLGMVYANLTSSTGAQLSIKEDASATLKFPIPAEYLASAPAFMPTWSFNETTGYWEQELQATVDNGFYEVQVGHFSWWNADWPYAPVSLKGTLIYEDVTEARRPIENQAIRISIVDRPWTSTVTYSNELGKFCVEIPKLNIVNLEILDDCGEAIYTSQIQQTSVDTDIGEIIVNYNEAQLMQVNGILLNCDLEPVSNGYAIIQYGDGYQVAEVNTNGNFFATIPKCQSITNILVSGYDRANLMGSAQVSFNADVFILDIGTLDVCEDYAELFVLKIDEISYPLFPILGVNASLILDEDTLVDNNWTTEIALSEHNEFPPPRYVFGFFGFIHQGVGTYQDLALIPSSGFTIRGELNTTFAGTSDPLLFTELRIIEAEELSNEIGSLKAEFSATWEDLSGNPYDVTGYFRIK